MVLFFKKEPLALPSRRLEELEVLRACAVLLVIAQHAAGTVQSQLLDRVTRWGAFGAGVDMFFVISGFVIARGLLPELAAAESWAGALPVMKRFWIRRIWRIWPAAWLWLGLILIGSMICDPSVFGSVHTNALATAAGILNFANVRFAYAFGHYFYGGSFQYWSLSVEEQFYIALPLLAFCTGRFLAPVALVFIAVQIRYDNTIFYWWSRDAELFYGVLLAMFASTATWSRIEPIFLKRRGWLAAVLTGLLLISLVRYGSDALALPKRPCVVAAISTIVVWLASYDNGYVFAPGRLRRWLVWLGSRSFALYLAHVPVLLVVAAATRAWESGAASSSHGFNHALGLLSLPVMLGLAELTYRCVERPLRDYGRDLAARPPRPDPPPRHTQIDDIETLRAIAVAFVLVQHTVFNLVFDAKRLGAVLSWGQFWCGVDLFFVISGFLTARHLLPQMRPGPDAPAAKDLLRRFWLRRAWRLWPAAWLWLALPLLGSLIWRDPPILGTIAVNLQSTLAGVLAFANLRFAAHPFMPYGPTFPYWSLALEEQFYLVLPLAMLALGRRLPWLLGILILVQFPLAHHRWFTYLRSDAMLWGVALAFLAEHAAYRRLEPVFLARFRIVGLVIAVACLVMMVRLSGPGDYSPPFAVGCIAALAALLVWLASYNRTYIGITALARPLLLWGGSRSYTLYLTHVPVYQCAAALSRYAGALGDPVCGPMANLRSVAIAAPMLLAAVELTHRYVEKPLRGYGTRRLAAQSAKRAVLS